MYPPPSPEILERLRGDTVDVVSFGKYTIHIVFDSKNRLSLAAPFRFDRSNAFVNAPSCELPVRESKLMRAVGTSVASAECEKDGTLHLRFSNGDLLVVYANDPRYEAYTLEIDGEEHLV